MYFLLLFYILGESNRLSNIIDYVKYLSNESSWLCHDRMFKFSINCLTTINNIFRRTKDWAVVSQKMVKLVCFEMSFGAQLG